MQIFNIEETGVSVVHKVGKVVAEVGRRVWTITSGERGKTHTVVIAYQPVDLSYLLV